MSPCIRYWQMALRYGKEGEDKWPCCFNKGIAAMGYGYDTKGGKREPVVTDCSKLSPEEYNRNWDEKRPKSTTCRESLRRLAYEMKKGDIIYVRKGIKEIVGKGKIHSGYEYDTDILNGLPIEWKHYVSVKWDDTFPAFDFNVYARLWTVYELKGEYLREIQTAEARARGSQNEILVVIT